MLEAIQLSKNYGGQDALVDLNLSVEPGEIYCLLGQNGAGKTTTINLFLGFIEPSGGKALINGMEVGNGSGTNQMTAYIPEVVQLYGNMSGIENLDFFSRLAGFTLSKEELSELLQKAGLEEKDLAKN